MLKHLNKIIETFTASSRSKQITAPPAPVDIPDLPKTEDERKSIVDAADEQVCDAQLKMEYARCDLHPLYNLRTVVAELPKSLNTPAKMNSRQCTRADCNRHYAPEFGYFRFAAGSPPDLDGLDTKRTCSKEHGTRQMVVTKLNGKFLWACPEQGCVNSIPFEEGTK